MVDKDGPKLLEINPRFGGGYPCAHLAGAAFPQKVLAIRRGEPLVPDIGACPDGICMLKQDEIIQPDWLLNG
jgi:carbamoyl-phosphate synthase large subunit